MVEVRVTSTPLWALGRVNLQKDEIHPGWLSIATLIQYCHVQYKMRVKRDHSSHLDMFDCTSIAILLMAALYLSVTIACTAPQSKHIKPKFQQLAG
ncbi:hypothetical protein K474DRAFT_1669640 [Panus rudis PR-1116 ss-1]|nr:hypothetical protein K474DRAFT_1669640 [Panus rudis PR-1116 ss-1]